MSSSMRNAIQRRNHKERGQLIERRKLGLLEKKKDYSKRAKDYNAKKAKLKALREKAALRNEDEFYFGMMSRKGPGSKLMDGKNWTGKVRDKPDAPMDLDLSKLLKTQDIAYVRTMRQIAARQAKRLEEEVVLTKGFDHLDDADDESDSDFDAPPGAKKKVAPRKIYFMDNEDEREDAMEVQLEREEREEEESEDEEAAMAKLETVQQLQKKLEHYQKQVKVLTRAENMLEVQQAKMAKTATSGGKDSTGRKLKVRTRKR